MVNYPSSFKFRIYFNVTHLYDLCELCLPLLEESGLPGIRQWEIPLYGDIESSGLNKKLAELRIQKERGEKDISDSLFDLGEGDEEQGREIVLRLCYFDHVPASIAGQCDLDMYVHRHNTIEEIKNFVDCGFEFCRRLLGKTNVNYFHLYRSAGGFPYIPDAPLVEKGYQIVFVTPEEVEQNYDNPEAFWNYPWSSKEQHGDRYLLTRCLDMTKYAEDGAYHAAILEPHWNLIRAAKPGTIKYFRPYPEPDEKDIFYSGEPSLNIVGYFEDSLTLKYTCHLEPDQHVNGWEIFEIYLQLKKKQTKDEKELQQIQVVFDNPEAAERELRPLLEAGATVMYRNEYGQEIDIEQEAQLNRDKKQLAELRLQLEKVEERIDFARKTNIFGRKQSGENEREKDRLEMEIQLLGDRIADRESATFASFDS